MLHHFAEHRDSGLELLDDGPFWALDPEVSALELAKGDAVVQVHIVGVAVRPFGGILCDGYAGPWSTRSLGSEEVIQVERSDVVNFNL